MLKRYFRNGFRLLTDSDYRTQILMSLGFYNMLPDDKYLMKLYKVQTGQILNLDNPKTLNEKLQWMKIHNRRSEYTMMADKYRVRNYVAEQVGSEYLIPLLGVWDDPEEIDFDMLPKRFVLKCNHNSGLGMCICRDKDQLDISRVKKKLRKGLRQDYFLRYREWPYKDIPRKIIAEQYLEDVGGLPIVDYKFYCFGEKPQYFMVSYGEASHQVRNHKFNMQLESIDYLFKNKPTIEANEITFPNNFDEMVKIVEILCKGHQHIRVDLYNVQGKIYFGEMTFYSGGGFINIVSDEMSSKMTDLIDLDKIDKA